MSVKIRLKRRGRRNLAMYDIVTADSRAPRDGRFIEKLGIYNPNTNPATISLNNDKALDWLMKGAQPTDTVRAILSYRGIMLKKHLQIGVNKGAITQEESDKKMEEWLANKDDKIQNKRDKLKKEASDLKTSKLEQETKINKARQEVLSTKKQEADAALVAKVREANDSDTESTLEEEAASIDKTTKDQPENSVEDKTKQT